MGCCCNLAAISLYISNCSKNTFGGVDGSSYSNEDLGYFCVDKIRTCNVSMPHSYNSIELIIGSSNSLRVHCIACFSRSAYCMVHFCENRVSTSHIFCLFASTDYNFSDTHTYTQTTYTLYINYTYRKEEQKFNI